MEPIFAKKVPCLTPVPFLSHSVPTLGHTLKLALVTFENGPKFVGTLFESIPIDSGRFWQFSEKVTFLTNWHVTGVIFVTGT